MQAEITSGWCYPRVMAQSDRRRQPATYEDLLKVPDHLVAEIVDGELYATPRPAPRHADASSALGGMLHGPFDRGRGGPGGWRILDEPELHLARDIVVPNLTGWRRERLSSLPEEAYFSLAPDWICEVLSPSTAALDRVKKMTVYARERVGHAEGDDISMTLAAIMMKEPDWAALPAAAPAGLRRLLRSCLEKDPKRRLQAIGDARLELERLLGGAVEDAAAPAVSVDCVRQRPTGATQRSRPRAACWPWTSTPPRRTCLCTTGHVIRQRV